MKTFAYPLIGLVLIGTLGCTNMSPTQQGTMSGALVGGALGGVTGYMEGRRRERY
jgi:hypothetical protein